MPKDIKKKGFIECLSEFMSDSEGLEPEDLIEELKEQQIDIGQLKADVTDIVKRGSEERRLGWRRRARQQMAEIAKFFEVSKTIPVAAINVKDKISEFIKDTYGPGALKHAEAYFRNKDTLSDLDIINLLEDLERLDSLEKSDNKKEE
jgi:hypothetical protein